MPIFLLSGLIVALLVTAQVESGPSPSSPPLPRAAEGWTVEPRFDVGNGFAPSNAGPVAAPDGTVFVGRQSRTGPDSPRRSGQDSILRIKDGRPQIFAAELGPISGLEWSRGSLYVLHGTLLSVLRDADGDGVADQRSVLVSGLSSGADESRANPVAGGLRLGLDGLLYFAVDDRGVARACDAKGTTVRLQGGGVLRVRPDGSGLEVVSTGERCPRSVAIDGAGEVFSLGEPDSSGRWFGGLTHHIDGGHYGYPYQFLTSRFRTLPILGGGVGGASGQVVFCDEDGLPDKDRGSLFISDAGSQSVVKLELRRSGSSFRPARRTPILERGTLADFRPVSIAVAAERDGFWIGDAGSAASPSGRVYRLRYTAADRPRPAAKPSATGLDAAIQGLDHPALSIRLESQRTLAEAGPMAVDLLIRRLKQSGSATGRLHAVWALDAIGDDRARTAIRSRLQDPSPAVRLQAARSSGLHPDHQAIHALAALLNDRDASVRREAAIALGRIGDRSVIGGLLNRLAETDPLAAWSVRTAIRRLGYPETAAMQAALVDPSRRESALILADESWSVAVVRALIGAMEATKEPGVRGRMLAALAGQFRAYPGWDGRWWGPDPLTQPLPVKNREWSAEGSELVRRGLRLGLADPTAEVRFQTIFSLGQVGKEAAPMLRAAIGSETDPQNLEALVETLGMIKDPESIGLLTKLVSDGNRPEPVRAAALDAIAPYRNPEILRARLGLLYDPAAPGSLVARALPPLARAGILPPNDVASFLESPAAPVRAAAILSLNVNKPLPAEIRGLVIARMDDPETEVRQAAVLAAGALKLTEAVPRLIELAGKAGESIRPQAISALCRMPDPRAEAVYQEALKEDDPALKRAAEHALTAIAPRLDPATKPARMASARPTVDPSALRRFALNHQGDPRKGEELFRARGAASCANCHAPAGSAGKTNGRDLAEFTRSHDRTQLIDALLSPRAPVAQAHQVVGKIESAYSVLDFTDLISFLQGRNQRSLAVDGAR